MIDIFPADEYGLYDAPAESVVTVAAAGVTSLCQIDPTRVILVISQTDNTGSPVSITTSGKNTSGIYMPNGQGQQFLINYPQHGPLVCAAWSAWVPGGAGTGKITVITVSLRRSPTMYGYRDVFHAAGPSEPHAPIDIQPAASKPVRIPSNRAILRFLHDRRPDLFGER